MSCGFERTHRWRLQHAQISDLAMKREREREVKDMDHGWQNHVPVELPAFFVGEEPGK